MSKKDLLKEAIADAKAVRSTAIANAKLALEEAFTPKLQSMLSHKIAEEMDDELEEDDELAADTSYEDDEADDVSVNTEDMDSENEEADDTMSSDESYYESEEIDEMEDMDEDEMELEEIIKELEAEDESGDETIDENEDESEDLSEDGEEEEMDLEEIISALREEDEVEEEEEEEVSENEEELEEAYKVIRFLKSKINEVNLLNSKLLYSNKLFRSNSLSESQKMKVIETFDRANSVREVKLVYSTLSESITSYTPKRKVNESFASKTIGSTKPSKGLIVESNTFAARMQKLAGLK